MYTICTYMYVCCGSITARPLTGRWHVAVDHACRCLYCTLHTNTHTRTYAYIYMHVCKCVHTNVCTAGGCGRVPLPLPRMRPLPFHYSVPCRARLLLLRRMRPRQPPSRASTFRYHALILSLGRLCPCRWPREGQEGDREGRRRGREQR